MKETKLQRDELDVVSSNNGLSMYLRGLLTGREATPRSSLYNIKGKTEMLTPDEILSRWQDKLSQLQHGDKFQREVFQFDSDQLRKWGPQGKIAPISELLEDVVYPSFSEADTPSAFSTDDWKTAKRSVTQILLQSGCRSLRPVSYRRVVDDMRARDTLESNSGWPLFTRRNKPEVITQSIKEAEDGRWKTYPAIALFRNYNQKTRLVWMFPMSANLVEGSYFQPLQSILMRASGPAEKFLAPWTGFEEVRFLITEAYRQHQCVAASDFSSTDAHFKLSTSMEVYDVLAPCFQPKYRELLRDSIEYMHRIPLVIGPDTKLEGDHGVSSGSNWTNFIETIFDWILAHYVNLRLARESSAQGRCSVGELGFFDSCAYYGLYAIGDDMSWAVPARLFDKDFASKLAELGKSVGQEIKAEKTTNERDRVVSLQRLFQDGYRLDSGLVRAVYPTVRALKSLVYPERMHKKQLWSRDMAAIRAIMILENTVDHPLYPEFVKFVADGDPYLREFARKPRGYQAQELRRSRLVPGLNTTYNQEKRDSSLSEFTTIKLLARL